MPPVSQGMKIPRVEADGLPTTHERKERIACY